MGMTLELDYAVKVRSYPGSPRGGDFGLVIPSDDGALVALIDASGHGLSAYAVAQKARAVVLQHPLAQPLALLKLLDEGLRGSDGAAVSIARIHGETLTFAGVGNVAARVDTQRLTTQNGIVGHRMRTPALIEVPFPHGSWLLMHTDGIATPGHIPPGTAQTVVQTLVETHGSDTDDASALALRWQEKV